MSICMNSSLKLAMVSKWMIINNIHNVDLRIIGDYLYITVSNHKTVINHQNITALNLLDELVEKFDEVILSLND